MATYLSISKLNRGNQDGVTLTRTVFRDAPESINCFKRWLSKNKTNVIFLWSNPVTFTFSFTKQLLDACWLWVIFWFHWMDGWMDDPLCAPPCALVSPSQSSGVLPWLRLQWWWSVVVHVSYCIIHKMNKLFQEKKIHGLHQIANKCVRK